LVECLFGMCVFEVLLLLMEEVRGVEEEEEGSLSTPPNPSRFVPDGRCELRAFSIHMIIDVIPSFEAHPHLGASTVEHLEARGTSAGSPCGFSLARLAIHPSKSPEDSTS
jgi:hypothetical protein